MEEKNTNATKRRNPVTWVPSVYFAMGLPFVVLNMVTVLMFKGLDISDAQIALWTSVIMLPWTLKPLWSPFLEMYRTKKFFVVLTQLLSGCLFGLVALALNLPSFFALSIALLGIIALSGATHDVATDGVYMKELSPEDQAKYIGWQGAFYNLAKIVATGGLVYLAGYMMQYFTGIGLEKEAVIYAWMIVMLLCGTIMILLGFYHMKMLPSGGKAATGEHSLKESMAELWLVFKEFFTKKYIVWYICFIILYRFAEGFVIKIVPLFLKAPVADQGLGLTEQEIGLYYGTFGAAAFVLGSLLGGYYISAKGLRKVLFTLCCCFNIPFLVYTFLACIQPDNGLIIASAIVFEYFGYGFGFVGLMLFMMQQVAPGKHQMAHYAFASGIMNLGVMLPGMMSGFVSDSETKLEFECDDKEIGEFVYAYDPRVCFIEDRYYVTWCNGYHGPTIGVAYTFDFETFHQLENAYLPFNRNGVMFPRKINGNFAMLSRPSDNGHTPFGDIFYSESPDMCFWGKHRHVMSPAAFEDSAWQCTKIGAGPIPIETSEGWLLIYHGVLRSCNGYVYSFGSAILDLEQPWKVKFRSGPYLLSPQKDYECMGDVPNVVFPCAALHDPETKRIAIYYGCADTVTGLAFGYIDEILDFTKKNSII